MIQLKKWSRAIMLLSAGTLIGGCSNSSSGGGTTSSLSIPNMTAPVAGTTSSSISSFLSGSVGVASTGVLFSGTSTPSDTYANSMFTMVQNFMTNGKTNDGFACMIEVLAKNNLLKTDGTATVFRDDQQNQFRGKFVVNAVGTQLQNFKMFVCSQSASVNDQFVSGSLSGQDASFIMKFNISNTLKGSMDMSGVWNGTNWNSKSLTMEMDIAGLPYKFQIAQNSDNMIVKGTFDGPTSGDSDLIKMYGKFALLGSSPATYAMGAGTAKYKIGSSGTESTGHWDILGLVTSTASAYANDVTNSSYFETVAFAGDMTTEQQWDCQTGSATEVLVSSMSQAVITEIQSCMETPE